jgi:hypothetical protein
MVACADANAPEGGCPGAQLVIMIFDDKPYPRQPQRTEWGDAHELLVSPGFGYLSAQVEQLIFAND